MYIKGSQVDFFLKYDVFLFLKVALNLANSAYLDEIQHYGVFHLCLHYLPKYPYRGFLVYINMFFLNYRVRRISPI